jgi:hypothetical protein
MKKIIVILTVFVLFSLALDVPQKTSYYAASWNTATGLQINNAGWSAFTEAQFDVKSPGLWTLQGDQFISSQAGLTRVTGNCLQSKAAEIALYGDTDTGVFVLAQTNEPLFTFDFVTVAQTVRIYGYNYFESFDVLKCTFVFEALE